MGYNLLLVAENFFLHFHKIFTQQFPPPVKTGLVATEVQKSVGWVPPMSYRIRMNILIFKTFEAQHWKLISIVNTLLTLS